MKSMMIQQKNGKNFECLSLSETHFYQHLLRDLEFAPEDEHLIHQLAFKVLLQEMFEAIMKDKNVQIEYETSKEKETLLETVLKKLQTLKEIEIH